MILLQLSVLDCLAREKYDASGLTMKQLGYNKPSAMVKKVLQSLEENNLVEHMVKQRPQQPRYKLTERGKKKLEKLTRHTKCLYTNNYKSSRKKTLYRPLKDQGLILKLEEAQKHIHQLEQQILELQNRKHDNIHLNTF